MVNFLKTDKGIILLLLLIFFLILPFFFLHQGLLLIDTGREFYIPAQILNGKILYKDILNQYGALSYQINAMLFLIFGQKINTLYFAGIFNSLVIVIAIYLLAREFLNKLTSFLVSVLVMFSLVFATFLYNSNLTYCFAIIYALSSFLLSLLCLIKYVKTENKLMAYLACFFAGFSIANKYEFILYPLVILYTIIFVKPIGIKGFFVSLFSFLIIPFLSIFSLGLSLYDIKEIIRLTYSMINAPSLKIFFAKFRVYVDTPIFTIFGILPILNITLFGINFKKIYSDKALFIFLSAVILASAKSFLFLNVSHMGIFLFPFIILASVILLNEIKYINLILCACILLFSAEDFNSVQYKNYKLETAKGYIYTFKKDGEPIKYVSDFILNNTNPEDKIVIMPEGHIINFITDRKSDNYYYNLSPMFYDDVFGEKKVLSHFEQNPPEYFVILPINNIEYGKSFFGIDYAQNFYEMINKNYYKIDEHDKIKIFRKK